MRTSTLLLLAVTLTGCSDGLPDVERLVTISQGVYGQTTYSDDVCRDPADCRPRPTDMHLVVRAEQGEATRPVASDEEHGFYELALEDGSYRVCTVQPEECSDTFTVAAGVRVRRDYDISLAPPGWCEGADPC